MTGGCVFILIGWDRCDKVRTEEAQDISLQTETNWIELIRRYYLSRRKKLINNSSIPQHEIENIARVLLPDILAFYESEEGQREFAEWKAQQDADAIDNEAEKIA